MFKLLCVLAIGCLFGCLIGSGRFKEYMPKVSVGFNHTIYSNKDNHYGIGKTKSGETCRIVRKWGNTGLNEPKKSHSVTEQFLLNNLVKDGQTDENGIKYDCFFDIDTHEHKLEDYTKAETISGFDEKYVFLNRDKDAECIRFQYDHSCKYSDSRSQLACGAYGQCISKEQNYADLIVISILFIFMISAPIILFNGAALT